MKSPSAALLVVALVAAPVAAQHEHMDVVASAAGGGRLQLHYEFEKKIRVYETFCLEASGQCLFSSINPAFLSPLPEDPVAPGFYRLADGVRISLEIVAIDAGLALNVNGNRLNAAGRSAVLGTTPFHSHPSWQLLVPQGEAGDYHISYRLWADSAAYAESAVYSHLVTNVEPVGEPTPTPTPEPPCPGDCNNDGEVTVDEVITGVSAALGAAAGSCPGMDGDGNLEITIDEIILAVQMVLHGCSEEPTPQPVSFAELQESVFAASCLASGCHNARDRLSGLVLEGEEAYGSLVSAAPENFAAAARGLLRVVPGDLDSSFLWVKLNDPRPEYGSAMPLQAPPLRGDQLRQVRDWILLGAPR